MNVAAFQPDDTINDVKLKAGLGYLFVKKKKWVSSRSILEGRAAISKQHLQGVLVNLGVARSLHAPTYALQDLLALNLDGEYDVCVALGQSMPSHVPVNPKFYKECAETAAPDLQRLLLDYLPVVGDRIYKCADVPNAELYHTHAAFWPSPERPLRVLAPLVRTVKAVLPARANHPVPLSRLFQTLHASEQCPVIRLHSSGLCRVHHRIDFQTVLGEEALTCVFSKSLLCNFLETGEVEIYYTPSKPAPLAVCNGRLRHRLNPFIALLNRAGGNYPEFTECEAVNMTVQFPYDGPAGQPRVSSSNVAQKAAACTDALQLARLGFSEQAAAAVLAGEPALPLHMRVEAGLAVVSNVDNPLYLPYLTNFEELKKEKKKETDWVPQPNLTLVGLNPPTERPTDQEVYDFLPAHSCRYSQTVHPAVGVKRGDLPLGIQAFMGDDTAYKAKTGTFVECVSAVLAADFRLLVGDLDPRFGPYPDVLAAFATNPRHPRLQCCARDNFVRFLRGEPDHTYLWDLVCLPGVSPDGFNLVLFTGDCAHEAVVLHKGGCPFDPARRSIVLWKRGDLYAWLRTPEAAVFSFSDFEFLKKMLGGVTARPPFTADSILRTWGGAPVVHRGQRVGVLLEMAGRVGMVPCVPTPAPKKVLADASVALADLPRPTLADCRAFLERADARLNCRPKWWVEAAGRCIGVLTESRHFAPCQPTAPPDMPAVTVQELKNPYPARDYEATLCMVCRDLPVEVEWVEALPPELQTYPRYVRSKLLVPKHLRPKCAFQKTAVAGGAQHDLAEGEALY